MNNNLNISINTLKDDVISMIDKCEKIVDKSVTAMIKKDLKESKEVLKMDDDIDELRSYVRDKSIELIALKQPMAKDLRFIYSLGYICVELERIGDYAVNIAKETIKIGDEEYVEEPIDIEKMKDLCVEMLKNVKIALETNDSKLAYKTAICDDIIDDLYNDVYIDAVAAMRKNETNITQGIKLLFIGRYLERIGDHITNVCEKIIYAVKGEMVEIG